jgi:hypothetical protein
MNGDIDGALPAHRQFLCARKEEHAQQLVGRDVHQIASPLS